MALFAHGQRQRHKHQGAACKLEGAYAFIEEQRAGEGGNHHGGGDYKGGIRGGAAFKGAHIEKRRQRGEHAEGKPRKQGIGSGSGRALRKGEYQQRGGGKKAAYRVEGMEIRLIAGVVLAEAVAQEIVAQGYGDGYYKKNILHDGAPF